MAQEMCGFGTGAFFFTWPRQWMKQLFTLASHPYSGLLLKGSPALKNNMGTNCWAKEKNWGASFSRVVKSLSCGGGRWEQLFQAGGRTPPGYDDVTQK